MITKTKGYGIFTTYINKFRTRTNINSVGLVSFSQSNLDVMGLYLFLVP